MFDHKESDMEEAFFTIKTKDPTSVDAVLKKQTSVEFGGLNVLSDKLTIGQIIFIVFGGDKPSWETGLVGVGCLSKLPYDFEGKNFKVQVDIKVLFSKPIKRGDLVQFPETFDIIGIGPITKWEPNQALSQVETKKAYALLNAVFNVDEAAQKQFANFFSPEQMGKIQGNYKKFIMSEENDVKDINEKKSLIGFYFSKFNKRAMEALGYTSFSQAFDDLSIKLSGRINSYIKQRRDEFDVFFPDNGRVGYQNREPTKKVHDLFEKWNVVSFEEMTVMIKDIIATASHPNIVCTPQKFTIPDFGDKSYFTRYVNSLLAKPFVILTGCSGTGKTQIARRLAGYLEKKIIDGTTNCLFVPVGADWTDNTKILGYYNPLADKGAGDYVKTDVVRFIEQAVANPEIPFFLILDEMNLSHVERYFSDFLSMMELQDYNNPDRSVSFDLPNYGRLEMPKNLFITGTVNIDETTYMFSPKVLDRANVIEFKPEKKDILANLLSNTNDSELKLADEGIAEGFLQLANDIRCKDIPADLTLALEKVKLILDSFYVELEKCDFEFAYRTVKEIRLYAIATYETAEGETPSATNIADVQILQKILPKIHGNRKQIGELLDNLQKICDEKNLPLCGEKIRQMKNRLERFQYASFI
jgi:MoxR-like ATPase